MGEGQSRRGDKLPESLGVGVGGNLLCLLAPAVCVHNKPLLTITLQPGQLPGERTPIPSPAFSAALELSLFPYLSLPGFPLTRVWLKLAQEGSAQKQVCCSTFYLLLVLPSSLPSPGAHSPWFSTHIANFTQKVLH